MKYMSEGRGWDCFVQAGREGIYGIKMSECSGKECGDKWLLVEKE